MQNAVNKNNNAENVVQMNLAKVTEKMKAASENEAKFTPKTLLNGAFNLNGLTII